MHHRPYIAVLGLLMALAVPAARAGVVATENFESYSPGAFANGSSGGTGWAAGCTPRPTA